MTLSPEVDCRLAIIRGLIEAWEEAVDKNLSQFNQLGNNRCFQWAIGVAESTKMPLTLALCQGERG